MLKKRDASELSVNIIIVAVIGLLVLVVVIAIFIKESGKNTELIGDCETRGGECVISCDGPKIRNICPNEDEVCCIKIGENN